MLCWRGQGMEVNNNVASCLFTSTWFVGSSWEVDTMELWFGHTFWGLLKRYHYELWVHFLGDFMGHFLFNFCWFKLAISGKAIKPAAGLFSFSLSWDRTSRQVWISMKCHPSFWNLFSMVKIKGVVGIWNFFIPQGHLCCDPTTTRFVKDSSSYWVGSKQSKFRVILKLVMDPFHQNLFNAEV